MIEKPSFCRECKKTRDQIIGYLYWEDEGERICSSCRGLRNEKRKKEFQDKNPNVDSQYSSSHIICPHCGHEHTTDSDDYEHEGDEYECYGCDEIFYCTTHHLVSFETKKQ